MRLVVSIASAPGCLRPQSELSPGCVLIHKVLCGMSQQRTPRRVRWVPAAGGATGEPRPASTRVHLWRRGSVLAPTRASCRRAKRFVGLHAASGVEGRGRMATATAAAETGTSPQWVLTAHRRQVRTRARRAAATALAVAIRPCSVSVSSGRGRGIRRAST